MLPGAPLMPGVYIDLHGPNGVPYHGQGLVDSGADRSLFPVGLAQRFGIDIADCTQTVGGDASGGSSRWQYAPGITATFEGRTIPLEAWFGGVPIILLGRIDFFAAFRQIAFNETKRFFTISD